MITQNQTFVISKSKKVKSRQNDQAPLLTHPETQNEKISRQPFTSTNRQTLFESSH